MTLQTGGPISLADINGYFGRGLNLLAYRGVQWWDDAGNTGVFATQGPIGLFDFYGKRAEDPDQRPRIATARLPGEYSDDTWTDVDALNGLLYRGNIVRAQANKHRSGPHDLRFQREGGINVAGVDWDGAPMAFAAYEPPWWRWRIASAAGSNRPILFRA